MFEGQSSKELTIESATNIIDEIETAYFDIPFGNTSFQTNAFVVGGQITPQRAYRTIGLQLHSILTTLRDHQQRAELAAVDADELRSIIDNPSTSVFERRRSEIKLKHLTASNRWAEKLLNDTLVEVQLLYKHFKALPKFTREQFEEAEGVYFSQKLQRELMGIVGAREALVSMTEGMQTIAEFQKRVSGSNDPELIAQAFEDTVKILTLQKASPGAQT